MNANSVHFTGWRRLSGLTLLALFSLPAAAGKFSEGKRAFALGDFDSAVMLLSQAQKEHPKDIEIQMALQRAREKDSYMHSDNGRIYLNANPPRYADAVDRKSTRLNSSHRL